MFESNHKIMYPTDVDTLESLIKDTKEKETAVKTNGACGFMAVLELRALEERLVDFILTHDIEVLDLISRGRSDDSVRLYEEVNGRVMPYTYPEYVD